MKFFAVASTLFALFLFTSGCTNEQTASIKEDYGYDEVLHFHIGRSKSSVTLTEEEEYKLLDVLHNPLPKRLNPYILDKLTRIGFSRDTVPEKNFSKLNAILECEPIEENLHTECVPVYRDALIFRKQDEIIKIAQLCFQCGHSEFIGPWPNMISFGQKGEFEKLEALLKQSIH